MAASELSRAKRKRSSCWHATQPLKQDIWASTRPQKKSPVDSIGLLSIATSMISSISVIFLFDNNLSAPWIVGISMDGMGKGDPFFLFYGIRTWGTFKENVITKLKHATVRVALDVKDSLDCSTILSKPTAITDMFEYV